MDAARAKPGGCKEAYYGKIYRSSVQVVQNRAKKIILERRALQKR